MAKIDLLNISTKAPSNLSKDLAKPIAKELKNQLKEIQHKLLADPSFSVLVILQGMDAAGKDGIIRKVFTGLNPSTCSVSAFKKPTDLEMAHDFLWRVHQEVPQKGHIKIFNRSHYEDVLIQKVHGWVDNKTIEQRYNQINNFEKMLVENNTKVLKCYLHVSKERQRERLQERIDNADERYKHNENDWKERELWDEYMEAYHTAFEKCNEVPWTIVPSDNNWCKSLIVLQELVKLLNNS